MPCRVFGQACASSNFANFIGDPSQTAKLQSCFCDCTLYSFEVIHRAAFKPSLHSRTVATQSLISNCIFAVDQSAKGSTKIALHTLEMIMSTILATRSAMNAIEMDPGAVVRVCLIMLPQSLFQQAPVDSLQ